MTKDEEQMIANLMHRMHVNEQARIESALASARMDAVTRAEADRVRIEALSEDLRKEREAHAETADLLNKADAKVRDWVTENQRLRNENAQAYEVVRERNQLLVEVEELRPLTRERDALRAEVAFLQKRLGDFAQMEVAQLKSQTPKQHPVKVGEWVKRTKFAHSEGTRINTIAQVVGHDPDGDYLVSVAGSEHCWCPSNCTPCDPPLEATHDTPEGRSVAESVIRDGRKTEPKRGDTVRLVRVPTADEYPLLPSGWVKGWGDVGDARRVCLVQDSAVNRRVVVLDNGFEWPLSCIEIVRTEPDEIKVGDVVKVVSDTECNTWLADVGSIGTVKSIETIDGSVSVRLDAVPGKKNALGGYVSLCDVRKVTT